MLWECHINYYSIFALMQVEISRLYLSLLGFREHVYLVFHTMPVTSCTHAFFQPFKIQ